MEKSAPKTLVTGASSGIGRRLSAALCDRGHRVTGVARRQNRLAELAKTHPNFEAQPADLASPDDRRNLAEVYLEEHGPPDYLILNAGLAHYGFAHMLTDEQVVEQIEVNLMAVIDLTRRFVPAMLERGSGRIIAVSSVLGIGPIPFSAVYAASKAGVNNWVKGLRLELHGTGVSVSSFCPAGVRTDFAKAATGSDVDNRDNEEPVEKVVDGILENLDKDKAIVFPTRKAGFYGRMMQHMPKRMEKMFSTKLKDDFARMIPKERLWGKG